jgi:hypothetical protein
MTNTPVGLLGRDAEGFLVFHNSDDEDVRVSECCHATAKGCGPYAEGEEGYVGCRRCKTQIDGSIALLPVKPYTPLPAPLAAGDQVVLDPPDSKFPGVWTITKVNPTTFRMEQSGKFLRAHRSLVRRATLAQIEAASAAPVPVMLDAGQVVRAATPKMQGYYVVLADRDMAPNARVKLAKLGGEGGRTWRAPRVVLTPVTMEEILDALRPYPTASAS